MQEAVSWIDLEEEKPEKKSDEVTITRSLCLDQSEFVAFFGLHISFPACDTKIHLPKKVTASTQAEERKLIFRCYVGFQGVHDPSTNATTAEKKDVFLSTPCNFDHVVQW